MNDSLNVPGSSLRNLQSKDSHYISQIQIVKGYLAINTASRFMVAVDTGIPIQNVCRYVDMLKDRNAIATVRKGHCKISGELVEFLSTDPVKFPSDSQLTLWD